MAVHPTALIEPGVAIGRCTAIWDHVHIRHSTQIGEECIVGEKSYIAYDVSIGDRVKINAFVYICTGVTIERGAMICAGTVFTNDRFPRATTSDLRHLLPSDPNEETLPTLVREGATIGAQCTISAGITIGRFAMIGMGSLVTHDVPDFVLALGSPARAIGYVCRCGLRLGSSACASASAIAELRCARCGMMYSVDGLSVTELKVAAMR